MTTKSVGELRREIEELEKQLERRKKALKVDPSEIDRPRGVLSKTDRKWLFSDRKKYKEENTRQAVYERRNAIEERIAHSTKDLAVLADTWPIQKVSPQVPDEEIDLAIDFLMLLKVE